MRQRIVVQPLAQLDIEDAAACYENQRKGLGVRFINDIGELMNRIATDPEQFSVVAWDIRRALVKRFPYAVYFAVSGHLISIIAVVHQCRHSSLWNSAINFLREPICKPQPLSDRVDG